MINFPDQRTDLWTNLPDASTAGEDPRLIAALEEYLTALEAGAAPERQEFLNKHAAIADALDSYLDGLQLLHAAAPSLCPGAGAGPALPEEVAVQPTAPLGDFRIVREIGRGGMGIVYEAVQLSLGRRVALKVLPFVSSLDPKHLQRFSNEAKAAAHLHHPAIVPVYAVGCERSVHYYAMQYIEGQSLAALIQAMGQTPAKSDRPEQDPRPPASSHAIRAAGSGSGTPPAGAADSPTLATLVTLGAERSMRRGNYCRRVAQLGRVAAEALEHAHQTGIVHRDIKPANLMVDSHGQLWVTDFGLALMQNDVGLTVSGELLGTLRYMSPEQAMGIRGAVDHRTDVYSLGATLYELLTLQPLFQGQDRQELLQRIANEDPRPPRKLEPAVPEDLETIVLKALAKSPTERYATAQDLADDLQRFLDDRPILARRPTLVERSTKSARRHRALVVSALMLLVGSVAVLLATTVIIAGAYDRERAKAEEARLQHERYEEAWRQARQAVDLLAQISEEGLAETGQSQAMRRRLLEAALGYYQDFIAQHQDEPSIKAELQASEARVTRVLEELAAMQGSGQFRALTDKAVQKELKLSSAQRDKVAAASKKFGDRWPKDFRTQRGQSAEDRWAHSLELAREEEKAISDLLTPEQIARFRQIVLQLQQRGLGGFSDPDVVQALQLSKSQREQIRMVQHEVYLRSWDFDEGWKKNRKKFTDPWVKVQERVLEVFTAEQRAKWREMTGEPVAATVHLVPGGGVQPRLHFAGRPGPSGPPVGFSPKRPR